MLEGGNSLQAPHYEHAPIREAVIEIRPLEIEPTPVESLQQIEPLLGEDYKRAEDLFEISAAIAAGSEVSAEARRKLIGYFFRSVDREYIVQAKLDGFAFSRLEPYIDWRDLRDNAKTAWAAYRSLLRPTAAGRIGVRYINRLDIPSDDRHVTLEQYFRVYPELPSDIPQNITNVFLRLQIPQTDLPEQVTMIITQTGSPPAREGVVSIVLDIDVFATGLFSEEAIWDKIEMLRARKNQAFEACITDKTRDLIR